MLQQLAVLVVWVTYGPVSEEASLIVHTCCLNHQRGDCTVDIGLADNRDSLFVQQGVCCTRHDADLTLQRIPALDRDGIAGIFGSQILHRNLQSCYIFQFFRFDLYTHISIAVCNDFFYLAALCFYFFHLFGQFRKRNRGKLNVEFFQQLALVAHGGPEVERTRSDLKDSGVTEGIYHITYGEEILNAALKFRIGQAAVCHVGERNAKTAQHFSRCEQAALAVAETHTVLIRSLIARSPEEYRKTHFFCQSCTDIFRAEVSVREENSLYVLTAEFLLDFLTIRLIVKQPLLVDVCDINKFNAELF